MHAQAASTAPANVSRDGFVAASAALWPDSDAGGTSAVAFLDRYTRSLDDEDLSGLTPDALVSVAHEHWRDATLRQRAEDIVVIHDIAHSEAQHVPHSHLNVITDDKPFLVSSVLGALARLGIGVHLIVHPTFVVERSNDGSLRRIVTSAPDSADVDVANTEAIAVVSDMDDPIVESWIHVEIDWVGAERRDTTIAALRGVLVDVANATADWPRMRDRAVELAGNLIDETPADLRTDAARAAQTLNWLVEDNFTFLGYEEYDLVEVDGEDALRARPDSALGLMRHRVRPAGDRILTHRSREKARERVVLIVTKANSRSTVHRNAYLDYIGIKIFDSAGAVTGERRFLGLFSSRLYHQSVDDIPLAREKVHTVLATLGLRPQSHSGRELITALETYPRDELFQSDTATLAATINAIQHLSERRRTSVFIRRDVYERFVTVMVYMPRDVYNTRARLTVAQILRDAYDAVSVDHESQVGESSLARIYFSVRGRPGEPIADVDEGALRKRISEATRSWDDEFTVTALAWSESAAEPITAAWSEGFGDGYKDAHTPQRALADARSIAALRAAMQSAQGERLDSGRSDPRAAGRAGGIDIEFVPPSAPDEGVPEQRAWHVRIIRDRALALGEVLPIFANLGVDVIDERPYEIDSPVGHVWLYDFDVEMTWLAPELDPATISGAAAESFCASWLGWNEPDSLDRLVLSANLDWRDVTVVRAVVRYLRQVGLNYSNLFMSDTLSAHAATTRAIVALFHARFDPDKTHEWREAEAARLQTEIAQQLDQITNLDTDRVLRRIAEAVAAMVRTNFFQFDSAGAPKRYISFKFDPHRLSDLPKPVPAHEVWVYSPQVEGVHLRFGDIARGGLRWSDRREDFRTEVLGLVKAQVVKNAVIVPTGAKGGFYPKRLPTAAGRDAVQTEGRAAYVTFIRGLLDLTENQVTHEAARTLVHPDRTVRYDGDDSYLVVAADKGTATFSDLANSIALEYGYWLGDAFASGGSHGYDHKAMGITARGAWTSVERHFFELGIDPATDEFTAVGIGDMSGDVFGNGMLLSGALRLVAAFDHRDIFLDPDPLPDAFDERKRLFELPRSSWQDFDRARISEGGGVYSRSLKAIPVSPRMRERLGLRPGSEPMTPTQLIRAILTAPVDLLFNGGIGTYVKAVTESHAQVGDKSNDAIRIDGRELRATIVGEGGNLGLTQAGRIEAAAAGVHLNTDSIDNSAGVDTSDHEVNIKILLSLDQGLAGGDARDSLLASMTDDVASLVLADNVAQNQALGVERLHGRPLPVYRRLLAQWQAAGDLDRTVENLPDDDELAARESNGIGLYSPELSVIISYAKIITTRAVESSSIPDDPWAGVWLERYFPEALVDRYADELRSHPLARQIIATRIADDIVNHGGITFLFAGVEESQAADAAVLRAFIAARFIFAVDQFFAQLAQSGAAADAAVQAEVIVRLRRTLGRAARWFVTKHPEGPDPAATIARYGERLAQLRNELPRFVGPGANPQRADERERLIAAGIDEALADRFTLILDEVPLLEVVDIAERYGVTGESPTGDAFTRVVAHVFYGLSERFDLDSLLFRISALPSDDRWQASARTALRDDVYRVLAGLATAVLDRSGIVADAVAADADADAASVAAQALDAWEGALGPVADRVHSTLAEVAASPDESSAPVMVALRTVRALLADSAPTL